MHLLVFTTAVLVQKKGTKFRLMRAFKWVSSNSRNERGRQLNSGLSGHSKLLKGALLKPTWSALTVSDFLQPPESLVKLHFLH